MKNYVIFLLAIILSSCDTKPPVVKVPPSAEKPDPAPTVPETPISIPPEHVLYPTCASGTWCYDALAAGRVTNKLIKTDPGSYCPKYSTLSNKVGFWTAFAKAVTRAESGWKYSSKMTEKFIDSYTGKLAISAGMFQLSYGDSKIYAAYPDCKKLSEEKNLYDPVINIKCGMGIMDKIAGSRPTMRESLGRYWSVIRDNKNGTDGITLAATIKKFYPQCF